MSSDLTARARIRDSAIRLFAEKGIVPTTIRDIAHEAQVSSGLLRHHFGSKDGLRDACDEFALGRMTVIRTAMIARGGMADAAFVGTVHPESMLLQRYLVRSMMDGSASATAMFEKLVEVGEQWLADQPIESKDPRVYATALVAMQMGMFMMRDQMAQVLGVDLNQPANHARLLRATVEIFAQPLLDPTQADQAYVTLDRLTAAEES
ncbi:TetR/AcrR family transcriptional regulator [Actinoplanes friuliensis]|uniref:Putative TetR-family transcriptional regulator n=1 Tax=Actinoplanes friuliensis DSM 7358 TaxID=1246995 RepID=U5VQ58_9ACTN|nr:TetR family transcriptional regulator [Actinoplanes friuliensis]AGZ38952.1 putative TetR-family transcriptional regulator [Actinoplanes friuliensis DSM 7358]